MKFREIIDDGVKVISSSGNDDMMPHFLYCGNFSANFSKLERLISIALKENGIRSTIVTMLTMERLGLITKEKSKAAYAGKLKNDSKWLNENGSINEDLESFINNLHSQEEIKEEDVLSFFLPKLMENELKLVKEKDLDFMNTFYYSLFADVDPEEMKKSDSKQKYVLGRCFRKTKLLNVD